MGRWSGLGAMAVTACGARTGPLPEAPAARAEPTAGNAAEGCPDVEVDAPALPLGAHLLQRVGDEWWAAGSGLWRRGSGTWRAIDAPDARGSSFVGVGVLAGETWVLDEDRHLWRRAADGWVAAPAFPEPPVTPGPWSRDLGSWRRTSWPLEDASLVSHDQELWVLTGGVVRHSPDGEHWEEEQLPPYVRLHQLVPAGDALLAWGASGLWQRTRDGWTDLAFPFEVERVVAVDGALTVHSSQGTVAVDGDGLRCAATGLRVTERRVWWGIEVWEAGDRMVIHDGERTLWSPRSDQRPSPRLVVPHDASLGVDPASGLVAVGFVDADHGPQVSTASLDDDTEPVSFTVPPATDPWGRPLPPDVAVSGGRVWVRAGTTLGRLEDGAFRELASLDPSASWSLVAASGEAAWLWSVASEELWVYTPGGGVERVAADVDEVVAEHGRIAWIEGADACRSSPLDHAEVRPETCSPRAWPHQRQYPVSPDTVLHLVREGRVTSWLDGSGQVVGRAVAAGGYWGRTWLAPGLYTDQSTGLLVRVPLEPPPR